MLLRSIEKLDKSCALLSGFGYALRVLRLARARIISRIFIDLYNFRLIIPTWTPAKCHLVIDTLPTKSYIQISETYLAFKILRSWAVIWNYKLITQYNVWKWLIKDIKSLLGIIGFQLSVPLIVCDWLKL